MSTTTKIRNKTQLPVELLSKTLRSSSLKLPNMANNITPPPAYEELLQDWPDGKGYIQNMLSSIQSQVEILQNRVDEDLSTRIVRSVEIHDIPATATDENGKTGMTTYLQLSPLLKAEGGTIQELKWEPGSPNAAILFVTEAGAADFMLKKSDGIVWPFDNGNTILKVRAIKSRPDLLPATDGILENGLTRCVLAKCLPDHALNTLSGEALLSLGKGSHIGGLPKRNLGNLSVGQDKRKVYKAYVWQFYSIGAAVDFRKELAAKFNDLDIAFYTDPCNHPPVTASKAASVAGSGATAKA